MKMVEKVLTMLEDSETLFFMGDLYRDKWNRGEEYGQLATARFCMGFLKGSGRETAEDNEAFAELISMEVTDAWV